MKLRLTLRFGSTLGVVAVIAGCASGDNGQPSVDGGDATTGSEGGEAGVAEGGGPDAPAEAGRPDATVDGGADSGGKDGGPDATVEDGGGQDSTVDADQDSAVVDTGAADAGDAASDTSLTDTDAMDAGADGTVDSGVETGTPDSGTDGESEASVESGSDATPDTGAGQGPACRAVDGGIYRCNAGQHCCANAMTQASSCATVCDADAGTHPVDCAGSTGAGQCGSQLCCGTLVLNGGIPPSCPALSLTSACSMSACVGESPPTLCGSTNVIRLCLAASDCASDTANPHCCNYGSSPVNWCVSDFILNLGLQNRCLP